MTQEQLVAQSVAAWLARVISSHSDVAREALPAMDIAHFMRALAHTPGFDPGSYSLVLTGFGADEVRLRELAEDAGLGSLNGLSDSLNVAAAWRNDRANHPSIIALARGWHPGVSTLKHFEQARSRELVDALLEWAVTSNRFCATGVQRELLNALMNSEGLGDILSLESVTGFLEVWSAARATNANDAPRLALPQLGILADPALFSHAGKLEPRLSANRDTTRQIIDTSAHQIRALRKRITGRYRNDLATRDRLLKTLDRIDALRLRASVNRLADLTLDEAAEVWRPPPDTPAIEEEEVEPPPAPLDEDTFDLRDVATKAGDALLDNEQEELTELLEGLEEAIAEAIAQNRNEVEGEINVGEETAQLDFKIDLRFLDWIHQFCSEERWGGIVESHEPTLRKALEQYATAKHSFLEPARIVAIDGRELGLDQLLGDWDRDLGGQGITTTLQALFRDFVELRRQVIAQLDSLVHFPINWLSGRPAIAELVDTYLRTASQIYEQVQRHYRDMQDVDEGWARAVLEGVLALDIVQARCDLDEARTSWKALLLPTHPLHLWRYQRLVGVLRGLGASLEEDDRKAVLDQCRRPDQLLSVIFVSSLPDGQGGQRLLPISNDLNGLATFENLQNAYNGLDGMQTLSYALDRFAVTHRNHTSPLRLAIVNPPEATSLVAGLTRLLSDRRTSTVPTLRIELFATPAPSVKPRARKALEFSGKQQEIIEDRLTGGRLEMRVHEEPVTIDQLVIRFRVEPFHLVMIFDEAGVNIRRAGMGVPLPMSPFCVRKSIKYEERRNILRLVPTTDDPPFSEFMQLINEAESGQRDSTPHTWADAENLRRIFDEVLQGDLPGAHWLALADRALPNESGMRSVRLLMRREGQRDVLLVTRDYRRLAQLVRPAFDRCNLTMSPQQLERLLEEGVNLVGAGLLDLIKHDGTPDAVRVLGLAGMLLAARDYRLQHPQSLIVSVDHEIARLWLRLGKRGERCDLLCLRMEGGKFVVEPLEVKATYSGGVNADPGLITHAQQQLATTLEAVAQGLPTDAVGSVLSAPRCEMLKEVFVRGCLSRSVPAELRSQWSSWLKQLFRQEGETLPVQLRGQVVRIAIGSNEAAFARELATVPYPISVRVLTETDVQRLIDLPLRLGGSDAGGGLNITPQAPSVGPASNAAPGPAKEAGPAPPAHQPPFVSSAQNRATQPVAEEPADASASWPPQVNAFGMIGQNEIVRQLLNELQFARDFDRRFNDKLFIGSAGVGKSSLARAIARELLREEPILFNGADLHRPRMMIERLQQREKVPTIAQGQVRIAPSLLFIDEVHAIHPSVVTVLLGALDDARTTTIDNVDYEFHKVVLLMATTDQGKLPEAFRSRPDKVLLRNYTLDELAGILWLHGRDELDGFELPRDVCIEVAARTRARPRDAVRMLGNQVIPHFHAQVREAGEQPSRRRIGEQMTLDRVAAFFDVRGIDANGIDDLARNYLRYLQRNGATAEERLRQGLGIGNRNDFVELDEYLMRLGLVTIQGGRALTQTGRRYLDTLPDLRHRIARQIS